MQVCISIMYVANHANASIYKCICIYVCMYGSSYKCTTIQV